MAADIRKAFLPQDVYVHIAKRANVPTNSSSCSTTTHQQTAPVRNAISKMRRPVIFRMLDGEGPV
eukprot:scaffold296441_cov33-Tisochrysis_lutea.AAC.2